VQGREKRENKRMKQKEKTKEERKKKTKKSVAAQCYTEVKWPGKENH
jgi:hypothetical protein